MKTKPWAMGLVFLSTLSTAIGQLLIKLGLNGLELSMFYNLSNVPSLLPQVLTVLVGYGLYGMSAGALIYALKYGELSVLYPIYAMNFIWVAIAIPYVFPGSDSMNLLKWAGVLSIVAGVILVGVGSGRGHHD